MCATQLLLASDAMECNEVGTVAVATAIGVWHAEIEREVWDEDEEHIADEVKEMLWWVVVGVAEDDGR